MPASTTPGDTGQRHLEVKCLATGSCQQETEQPPIPLGTSHTKVGPLSGSLPAPRQHPHQRPLVGLSMTGNTSGARLIHSEELDLRTGSEGGGERGKQSNPCFLLRLLFQEAY